MQDRRVALITGASSGIGEITARFLARRGFPVILVARRRDRLQTIIEEIRSVGGQAAYLVADLSQEGCRLWVADQANLPFGPVEILINNAGFGWYGYADTMPWHIGQGMLDLNVVAATHLTQLFLAQFKARGSGHIINVGSIVGNIPSQGVALYSGSKSFLEAYTTAIYRELSGSPIRISLLRLGAVRTSFFQVAQRLSGGIRIPVERIAVHPTAVAKAVFRVLKRPRRMLTLPAWLTFVPWLELSFGWIMDRIGPRLLQFQGQLAMQANDLKERG